MTNQVQFEVLDRSRNIKTAKVESSEFENSCFLKRLGKETAGVLVLVGHVNVDPAHLKDVRDSSSIDQSIPYFHNIW